MLKGKITDHLIESPEQVWMDPSRCSRMRHNRNTCDACLKLCVAGSISMEGGIAIRRNTCSECMLCASECPSGVFHIHPSNFSSMIARLRKVPSPPVIGCRVKSNLSAHEKTPCLGFLSEEHLLALLVFLPGRLQLNLTECDTCPNGTIVSVLRKRLDGIEAKTSLRTFERVRLVEKKGDLDYEEVSYDRRGFFKAIKDFGAKKTASLLDNGNAGKPAEAFSSKILPVKRKLLNQILPAVSGEVHQGILKHYYYRVTVDQTCDLCFACVGMCPTGALKSREEEAASELLFYASLCSGCGLCAGFCRNYSVKVEEGFPGPDPFAALRLTGKEPQPSDEGRTSSLNIHLSDHSCS